MYELQIVSSSLAHCVWRATADRDDTYSDSANEYWSIGFVQHGDGAVSADLYGPTTTPRLLPGIRGEEYWGIEFHAHVAIKGVDKGEILNSHTSLLVTNNGQLQLFGRYYDIPSFDELETFAVQLEKDGVLVDDQRIFRAMNGETTGFSTRSMQRHVKSVTGLSKKQIEQLQRARHAFYLLQSGSTPAEAAQGAGYADQSHMTRALKVLRGETPARIIAAYLKCSE